MPFSVIADVVSQRSKAEPLCVEAVCVKHPSVLNSASLTTTCLMHGGGGGGGGPAVALTLIVRVTVFVCDGLPPAAVAVIRTLTSCGPDVVNVYVGVRDVESPNVPSLLRSHVKL